MAKIPIGTKIRVVSTPRVNTPLIGEEGIVVKYDAGRIYNYEVKFPFSPKTGLFYEDELEIIEE